MNAIVGSIVPLSSTLPGGRHNTHWPAPAQVTDAELRERMKLMLRRLRMTLSDPAGRAATYALMIEIDSFLAELAGVPPLTADVAHNG